MIDAIVYEPDNTSRVKYKDVRLNAAGVIIETLVSGGTAEALIPWHRVHTVVSNHPGEITLELGQETP